MVVISKKNKNKITITPVGYSAEAVTGSCNLLKYDGCFAAIELGGIQEGHTVLENYNLNKRMLSNIKSKELQFIFVAHLHYDHIGMIPAMYARGCNARIIVPAGSTRILKEMWLDSAHIMEKDCEALNRKSNKNYEPFYNTDDIEIALGYIEEYDSDILIELTDTLSLTYRNAGHIMLSKQIEIFIRPALSNHTYKILITSDLGNLSTEANRIFVEDFYRVEKANIVIGESTYGLKSSRKTRKDFKKDLEKIRTVIDQYCVDNANRVLIPTFSLDKMAVVLWYLYELFGANEEFNVPIIVDSPLAIRLLKHYQTIMEEFDDERIEKFKEMMAWKNIHLISDHQASAACISDKGGKVILSSGGMLQSGRSVTWAQSIIPRSNDCIMFMGYCGVDTLGYHIKHSKEHKTVTINNKVLANRCQIVELLSFSSHMQHEDLVNYYKGIVADKIYLLHGDEQSRLDLKKELSDELSKMSKTTKVSIVNKSTVINL